MNFVSYKLEKTFRSIKLISGIVPLEHFDALQPDGSGENNQVSLEDFFATVTFLVFKQTSWDRPKSAPYPRLKNSKRTSKCQFTVFENQKNQKNEPSGAPGPASASPYRAKRGTLPKLSTFLSQLKGGPFGEKTNFREKKVSMPKN